jgi:hypothetical protein
MGVIVDIRLVPYLVSFCLTRFKRSVRYGWLGTES